MVDPDGHAACRVLADECADASARSQLAALRSAAAAADAAVRAAVRAAERADAAAARAQAAADQPCRLGDPDDCASWRHSRTAEANRARAAARTAWSIVSAVARNAAQAHRAVAQAERAQAAAKRRAGQGAAKGTPPANAPRPGPRPGSGSPSTDTDAIWDCFQGGIAPMYSCDSYRRLTAEKAAARSPDCGPLATKCLKDSAGAVSALTGTAALAAYVGAVATSETGIGGFAFGATAVVLSGVSFVSSLVSTVGSCSEALDAACAASATSTGLSIAAAPTKGLQLIGVFGRDVRFAEAAADAWKLTLQFMAQPFTWLGPWLSVEQFINPVR